MDGLYFVFFFLCECVCVYPRFSCGSFVWRGASNRFFKVFVLLIAMTAYICACCRRAQLALLRRRGIDIQVICRP